MEPPLVNLADCIPDICIDVKYAGSDNFIAQPVDGYLQPKALILENVAEALSQVQKSLLAKGFSLKIFDAYRPQRAVDHFIRWSKDAAQQENKQMFYPNINKSELFDKGYLAMRSSHSRGSTVDLTIVRQGGDDAQELDMGTCFDFFDSKSWISADNINEVVQKNRAFLQNEMGRVGFQPFETEWWHFTLENELYPDQYFDIPIA